MNNSTPLHTNSCIINEVFDADNITPFAGANIIVDHLRKLDVTEALEQLSVKKAPWAEYSTATELQLLMTAYMMGIERIEHTDVMQPDPFLALKFGLKQLPSKSNLYRVLERFDTTEKVAELSSINTLPLNNLISRDKLAIIDIDSTVNTVHGHQEGTTVGYNPRYHGRASYQPLFAFEGNSKATLHAELRNGNTPNSSETISVYQQAKANLPNGVELGYVRADRAFPSAEFLGLLEEEEVEYTIKLRCSQNVKERLSHGVLWKRIYFDETVAIEVGSVKLKLYNWTSPRKVVFVRQTKYADNGQLHLLDLWDYQAIVTNLDWDAENIWRFYNQRCTCENFIKELKYGLNIDNISKASYLANAADMWLKVLGYNILLVLMSYAPDNYQSCSIAKLQRMLFSIPGLIVKHARRLTLRLPSWWAYKDLWLTIRSVIDCVETASSA